MVRNIFLALFASAISLSIAEGTLRLLGVKTGTYTPYWSNFTLTDSLEVQEQFYTDSLGILVANSSYFKEYDRYVKINAAGFRSIPFEPDSSGSTSVLLIGDSFAWGASAEPVTSSVADLLTAKGMVVYNAGIPGADPAQYAGIAEEYLPQLNPDCLVILFYLGNDVMFEPRDITPYKPLYFQTNVGWLSADFQGHSFNTARQAYQYYKGRYDLNSNPSIFVRILGKTVIGTRMVALGSRINQHFEWRGKSSKTFSYMYLKKIRELCEVQDIKVLFVVIPDYKHLQRELDEMYPGLMGDIEYIIPFGLSEAHYEPWPDGHLNNSGHSLLAEFLFEILSDPIPEDQE